MIPPVRYTVQREYTTVRLVLKELFSARAVASIKRGGKILQNGQEVRADRKVYRGDELLFCFPPEENPYAPERMELLPVWESENFRIVDKDRGIGCMPTGKSSIFNGLKYLYPQENFHLLTRLDKDTAGLTLLAKSAYATEKMRGREIVKIYEGLAEGRVSAVRIDAPIARGEGLKRVIRADGKRSLTDVVPLAYDGENTMVECRLLTGRTHQIRVHLASIGHPLVGDTLYGNGEGAYNGGQSLLCRRLEFVDPFTEEQIVVKSQRIWQKKEKKWKLSE